MRDSVSPNRAASHRPDKSNELTKPMFSGYAALGEGDGQASVGAVVGGVD